MRRELPRGGASHAESADHNAVLVDRILRFHCVQGLEQVHFACKLVGVAVAPVKVKHDRVRRREFPGLPHADRTGSSLRSSVSCRPWNQASSRHFRSGAKRPRNHQSIRLDTLIDFRHIPANDETRRRRPGRTGPAASHPRASVLRAASSLARAISSGRKNSLFSSAKLNGVAEDLNIREQLNPLNWSILAESRRSPASKSAFDPAAGTSTPGRRDRFQPASSDVQQRTSEN